MVTSTTAKVVNWQCAIKHILINYIRLYSIYIKKTYDLIVAIAEGDFWLMVRDEVRLLPMNRKLDKMWILKTVQSLHNIVKIQNFCDHSNKYNFMYEKIRKKISSGNSSSQIDNGYYVFFWYILDIWKI
jgi:hypothetical protein